MPLLYQHILQTGHHWRSKGVTLSWYLPLSFGSKQSAFLYCEHYLLRMKALGGSSWTSLCSKSCCVGDVSQVSLRPMEGQHHLSINLKGAMFCSRGNKHCHHELSLGTEPGYRTVTMTSLCKLGKAISFWGILQIVPKDLAAIGVWIKPGSVHPYLPALKPCL